MGYDLLHLVDAPEARRVFIDGLGNLRAAAEAVRFREYLYSLVQRCSRLGVNLMMSIETAELFGAAHLTQGEASTTRVHDRRYQHRDHRTRSGRPPRLIVAF